MIHPTKATPFGCVIGFFGCLSFLASGGLWWIYLRAGDLEDLEKAAALRSDAALLGSLTAIAGVLICWIGYRLAMGADMREPYHPDKPKMR